MEEIRDENCNKCLSGIECNSVCVMRPLSKVDLMIVGDYPSWKDDEDGTVMKSEKDRLLMTILTDAMNVELDTVYFTYAVKCRPKDRKPDRDEVSVCAKNYLQAEIEFIQPKAIITLGEIAMNAVCGTTGISKLRGKKQITKIGNTIIPVIPTYSIAFVTTVNSQIEVFGQDIYRGYNLSKGVTDDTYKTKTVICETVADVKQLIAYCQETKLAAFDYETKKIEKKMVTFEKDFYATGLSISFQVGSAYFIPLHHFESPFDDLEIETIMGLISEGIFKNTEVRKIAHNTMFDLHVSRVYGVDDFRGRVDDTLLMHHLINEDESHKLKDLVRDYLPEYSNYEDALKGYTWETVPLEILAPYAGADTDMTLRLSTIFEIELLKDPRLYYIYRNMTMPAFKAIYKAEKRGMLIDREYIAECVKKVHELADRKEEKVLNFRQVKKFQDALRKEALSEEIQRLKDRLTKELGLKEARKQKRIDLIKSKISDMDSGAVKHNLKRYDKYKSELKDWKSGVLTFKKSKTEDNIRAEIAKVKSGEKIVYAGLNLGSWQQLEELLYYHPSGFEFETDEGGTGKDIIKELPDTSGFVEELLLLRSLRKTLSTYLEGIHDRLDDNDRVHSSWLLNGTESGRLSSKNPNLQNIPNVAKLKDEVLIRTVGMVKKSFIVPEDYTLLQVDYSQAELRIIASFANEVTMLSAYNNGQDLHALTAANMLGVTIEEFYDLSPKEQKSARQKAKAVNFGFIYGMGHTTFKDYAKTDYDVDITLEEAEETRDIFFESYPKLLDYHDTYVAKAQEYGWVRTLFGRRRRTPEILSGDNFYKGLDERVSINSPIQGTAGEFTIFAIALLDTRLPEEVQFVNTVHDSILYYVPDELLDYTIGVITRTCENLPTAQYFDKELKNVRMKVDIEISKKSWKDLQEI